MDPNSVSVLGAGSWGTALAMLLSRNGKPVTLWGHDAEAIAAMQQARQNQRYLPDHLFPDSLQLNSSLEETVAASRDLLIVVPSHAFRSVLNDIAPLLQGNSRIAWASKGLEPDSQLLLHEVSRQVLGDKYPMAVVSGPTFASEVASGLPTAVTVASSDSSFASQFADRLHDPVFRAYTSKDVIGVELGGAMKNVLAIAAGISDGLNFGANARAALITRGLHELSRLGEKLGGHMETFMGLAGLGDLVLTCTDNQSRNRRLGMALASGKTVPQFSQEIGQVVEGVHTAKEVHLLSRHHGVDMPICEQVYLVLHEGHDPAQAGRSLLDRQQKAENS